MFLNVSNAHQDWIYLIQ